MIVDTHCHLIDEAFDKDREEVVKEAINQGIEKMIVPSTSLKESREVVEWSEVVGGVFGLVGVHPEEVINNQKVEIEGLRELAENESAVGIGEIGLDFYWDKEKESKSRQMKIFEKQMKIASELDLPVVIHMREAQSEIEEVLSRLEELPRGQFHCWSGDKEFLRLVLERDFYVSFAGNVTYPKAERLRKLAKMVPVEKLLLETDSPYLSPQERRGSRNVPENVIIIGRFLAELFDVSEKELFKKTRQNTRELFNI